MAEKVLTAARIAEMTGGDVVGDHANPVTGVEALDQASACQASFLGNPKYRDQVLSSRAGVVLVPPDFTDPPPAGRAWVVCDDPSDAFSAVVDALAPPVPDVVPGIHASASVADGAVISDTATISAHAVVESGAVVGPGSIVGAGCYVGHDARIGDNCRLYPNVILRERCQIGNRVIIHSGTVIGSDGFGYVSSAAGHRKIPQVGIVQIDDDVEIGALVAVDRARFGRTWIKQGVKIDNLVQIAHNVVIGEHSIIVAQVGISGSTHLGKGVVAAGQVGIAGHLRIGDGVTMMAKAGVTGDLEPGTKVVGAPAVERREFARKMFAINSVAKLKQAVKRLEHELSEIRSAIN